jgi:hypothetical protein
MSTGVVMAYFAVVALPRRQRIAAVTSELVLPHRRPLHVVNTGWHRLHALRSQFAITRSCDPVVSVHVDAEPDEGGAQLVSESDAGRT